MSDSDGKKNVLVIIDVQNCFMAGGSLGAEDFKLITELITLINLEKGGKKFFDIIVFTKDTHPEGHKSFGLYGNHCRPYCSENKTHCFNGCHGIQGSRCGRKKSNKTTDFSVNKISIKDMLDMYEYSIDKKEDNELQPPTNIIEIEKNIDVETRDKIIDTVKKIRSFMLDKLSDKFEQGIDVPEKKTIKTMREIISKNEFHGESYYDKKIYGNDLSYLYKIAAIHKDYNIPNIYKPDVILTAGKNENATGKTFNPPDRNNVNPTLIYKKDIISMTDTDKILSLVDTIKKESNGRQIIVEMEKGMICDMDANSAFVYHVDYKKVTPENKFPEEIATQVKNSTGLLELLTYMGGVYLNIYNCGLVGNICVIQSAIHGAALTKLLRKTTDSDHKIKYMSCFGTRFLTLLPPHVADPDRTTALGVYNEKINELNKLNDKEHNGKESYFIDENILNFVHIEKGSTEEKNILQNLIYPSQEGGHNSSYHKYMKYKSKYHYLKTNN